MSLLVYARLLACVSSTSVFLWLLTLNVVSSYTCTCVYHRHRLFSSVGFCRVCRASPGAIASSHVSQSGAATSTYK
ncbi:hypothetical protein PR003_g8458 [Phytophthora rubi]|uniref:Uncharacterized protein n=1 Tax=Phytophthora rubi TaxID=129364 RepID=A0A6A4FJ28_9STRA|nr:hypothetical protein PR002_g9962 [Phytophthora rubi]KAE9042813.1 hypothetical protein PR001_g6041 [Phytophthora rubi]KAE9344473.1 hypothetical protein PR003_g8458 [Phytophthora rubi]